MAAKATARPSMTVLATATLSSNRPWPTDLGATPVAETPSRCPSCGGPLPAAPGPAQGAPLCPRCGAAAGVPEGQHPTAIQPAPRQWASPGPPRETRVQPRPDGAGPPPSGPFIRPAAEGGAWWKTALDIALASVSSAVRGTLVGAVAGGVGAVLLILLGGGGSSDGSGLAGIFIVPAFGAAVGFLLGLAIPLLRHAWRIRRLGPVVAGTLAGAVAGLLLLILTAPWMPDQDRALAACWIVPPFATAVGCLLGFAPLRWDRGDLRRVRRVVAGAFAGAAAGFLLVVLTRPGPSNESLVLRTVPPFGAAVGFLLSLTPPTWHAWKLRIVGSVLGTFAGAVAGVVLWFLAWVWGSPPNWDIATGVINFGVSGAAVGFLLGFAISLLWQGWKLLTTTRQSRKDPVEVCAEAGPLGDGSGVSDPHG